MRINNKHKFSKFPKPLRTDITIHNSSNLRIQHKLTAYNSMIHRSRNISQSTHNFGKRFAIIN